VITDLAEIRRLTESEQTENLAFRRYLHAHHQSIEPFYILASEIEKKTDCTSCANCCRYTIVNVNEEEISAIARYLHMTPALVSRLYTDPDPDDSSRRVLRNTNNACVFLDGNLCMVYEARPRTCRDFPHVRTRTVGSRFSSLCRRAAICPIIHNALDAYKRLVGYRAAGL
jgi:Fe-S-cluster containining protein